MVKAQVLLGHTSEATAHVTEDHPYGFNKKCSIRHWVETNEHGQRVVTQTTNPEKPGTVWNKPKKSAYSPLRIIYLDPADNRVKEAGISEHATKAQVEQFLNAYGPENFADEHSSKTLELMRQYRQLMIERYANSDSTIQVGAPVETATAPGEVLVVE